MQAKYFPLWLKNFSEQALLLNERRLVILSGNESWALTLLNNIVFFTEENPSVFNDEILIYGDSKTFPANVDAKRFRDKLGSESNAVIFADSQFRIDALAVLSGTIKSGGILFVVIPEVESKKEKSRFLLRFFKLLDTMSAHALIVESVTDLSVHLTDRKLTAERHLTIEKSTAKKIKTEQVLVSNVVAKKANAFAYSCATSEQLKAVSAIEKVVTGHRKRPLILTADRGRGKSSALAIACAQLLIKGNNDNPLHIIITAPDIQSLSVFFNQLIISLPNGTRQGNAFYYAKNSLEFVPVDQLLKQQPKVSLVLVDEAAAIPVYLLEQLLTLYHRMVFSSTVHGYEGAGRGFTLKFQRTLTSLCPNWRALHIKEPIRWRLGDPLEQFIFDTCLLNSELEEVNFDNLNNRSIGQDKKNTTKGVIDLASLSCKVFTSTDLMNSEVLLKQVFSILVTAHYQTKPSDVKLLLDNPNVQLVCLLKINECTYHSEVLAVALLLKEGDINESNVNDVDAIKNSQRRIKNNFLPQSLLTHCGFEQAFNYSYLRIMRIAVHPQLQQQGLGRYLLSHIEQLANKQKIDFIGASFGINSSLLSFWLSVDMQVTRIGFTKDKASGEHSVMVLKAMNSEEGKALNQLNLEFFRSFDFLLADEYKSLSADLVLLLLKQNSQANLTALTPLDLANVHAFAKGQRLYSNCAYSLYLWLKHQVSSNKLLESTPALLALISRLMQKHSIDELCQQYSYTGKKILEKNLKNYVQQQLSVIVKEEK